MVAGSPARRPHVGCAASPGECPPCLPGTPRTHVRGSRVPVRRARRRALYAGPVKVLVIGSGAREHAIVKALGADQEVDAVIVAPGNPGMDAIALCEALPGGVLDGEGIVELAGGIPSTWS